MFDRLRALRSRHSAPVALDDHPTGTVTERVARVSVSAAAFLFGALLITCTKDNDSRNFGFGLIGTVVGYWLR